MSKPSNKPNNTRKSPQRIAYEVRGPQGTTQVQATTANELKAALLPLLPLSSYSAQATAHLLHNDRVSLSHKSWSVKRLGVVTIVAEDDDEAPQPKQAQQRQEATAPTPPQADTQPQGQGQPAAEIQRTYLNARPQPAASGNQGQEGSHSES